MQQRSKNKWLQKAFVFLLAITIVATYSLPQSFGMFGAQEAKAADDYVLLTDEHVRTEEYGGGLKITHFNYIAGESPTKIIIPKNLDGKRVLAIGDDAFAGTGIQGVKFEAGSAVNEIGVRAFYNCTISELSLPSTITSIGSSAFYGAKFIGELDLSNITGLTEIPTQAFRDAGVTKLVLPPQVEKIGNNAFTSNLINKDVIIPGSMEEIAIDAFAGNSSFSFDCSSFEPNELSNAPWGFSGISNGRYIKWKDTNQDKTSNTPFLFDKTQGIIYGLKKDLDTKNYTGWDSATGKLTVPSSIGGVKVNGIADYGLSNSENLNAKGAIKEVVFGTGHTMTKMPIACFRTLYNLTKISNIPPSVKTLEPCSFGGSRKVKELVLPGVTSMETNAFYAMTAVSGLESVTFESDAVTNISSFISHPKHTEIHLENMVKDSIPGAPWNAAYATVYWKNGRTTPATAVLDDNGKWYFKRETGTIYTYVGPTGEDVDLVVPSKLTYGGVEYSITGVGMSVDGLGSTSMLEGTDGPYTFGNVTISDGIKNIGAAFNGVKIKGNLDLGNTLEKISHGYSFRNCGLTRVKFPETLTQLNGFQNNNLSGQIVIPGNVTGIGAGTFFDNENITSILVKEYRSAPTDEGAYDDARGLYKKASASVVTGAPYGAPNVENNTYFMDDPRPNPNHTVTVDKTYNTATIHFTGVTTNTFYMIKDVIKGASNMPAIKNLKLPELDSTFDGTKDPTTADMVVASKTASGIKGGNGAYIVDMKYGNKASNESDKFYVYQADITPFHSLTYNMNVPAGAFSSGSAPTAGDVFVNGYQVTLAGEGTMKVQGYKFAGWNTAKNGSGTNYNAGSKYTMGNSNVTLYAKWTKKSCRVTFNGNGGTPASQAITGDVGTRLTNLNGYQAPTRAGYKFEGWSTKKDDPNTIISDVPDAETATLYAVWSANKVRATFDANGGIIKESNVDNEAVFREGYVDAAMTPPANANVTRTGYTFAGWKTSKNGSGSFVTPTKFPTADTTYYAQWTAKNNTVRFAYDTGGKSVSPTSKTVKSGAAVGTVPTATPNDGYKFNGMWKCSEGGIFTSAEVNTYVISGKNSTVTFTAQFTENGKSTIVYDFNGGADKSGNNFAEFTGTAGSSFTEKLPEPTKTGYEFDNWYSSRTGGSVRPKPSVYPGEGTTTRIYAQYIANDNTIKFVAGKGGTVTERGATIKTGEKVGITPNRENIKANSGYLFTNMWHNSETGGIISTEDITDHVVDGKHGSITFTAMFEQKATSDITFDYSPGKTPDGKPTAKKTGYVGDKLDTSDLPKPTRPGYTFAGWNNLPKEFPRDNRTVTSKWTANDNTVRFVAEKGGSVTSAKSVIVKSGSKVGMTPSVSPDPGYSFYEWSCSEGGTFTSQEIAAYMISGANNPVTFTAKFKEATGGDTTPIDNLMKKSAVGSNEKVLDDGIKKLKSDGDIKGASFWHLRARGVSKGKKSVIVRWTKVTTAAKYIIYGNRCGNKYRYKKIKTVKKSVKKLVPTKIHGKKIKKNTYYKFMVVAIDKNGKILAISKTVHVATAGGKKGNDKAVKITKPKKAKLTLKVGKTYKMKVKEVRPSKKKKKVHRHRPVAYESTNKKVATVSKGKIKAKGKGKATIYAYAQNGVYKTVKVTVK